MIAILSDIHSNLEALKAVLDDIAEFDVGAVYCLGDIVGYGPNPCQCLDAMMSCHVVLLGNHEEAVQGKLDGFNPEVALAARWTREQLQLSTKGGDPEARKRFLKGLPLTHEKGDYLFVHASPRDPTSEYVYPQDIRDGGKMWDIFRRVNRYCFMGHTHIPGIFTESFRFQTPAEVEGRWRLDERKILCNVGSVGQPRDGDWRACYVLMDRKAIYFRKVPYDRETTLQKIKRVPELKGCLHYYQQ